MKGMTIKMSGEITKGAKKCRMTKAPYNLKLPSRWAPDDGDQRVWSRNKSESEVRKAKSPSCFTIVH